MERETGSEEPKRKRNTRTQTPLGLPTMTRFAVNNIVPMLPVPVQPLAQDEISLSMPCSM